jgi:predicted secreted protein
MQTRMPFQRIWVAAAMVVAVSAASAQSLPAPQNQISLSASGQIEAMQDSLSISLSTTKEGSEAQAVQLQLKQAVDSALNVAKAAAQPGAMEVRTGQFSLYPRYGRDGKISGWQGSSEVVLEGKDFARISATAGKIQSLTVNQVTYALSREQRALLETQAQAKAIAAFQTKAQAVAKAFGFAGYSLREVNISAQDQSVYNPRPRVMAAAKLSSEADSAVPVEAGKSTVTVMVSGSVQLK